MSFPQHKPNPTSISYAQTTELHPPPPAATPTSRHRQLMLHTPAWSMPIQGAMCSQNPELKTTPEMISKAFPSINLWVCLSKARLPSGSLLRPKHLLGQESRREARVDQGARRGVRRRGPNQGQAGRLMDLPFFS